MSAKSLNIKEQLLMVPGPTELDPLIYEILSQKTLSHGSPTFIGEFRECLNNFNKLLSANNDCQPFIISGGGTVGWESIIASLCQSELKDQILVLNGGVFSDRIIQCCHNYNLSTHEIKANIGDVVSAEQLKQYLTSAENAEIIPKLKLIVIVHVDTSTAVRFDVQSLAFVMRKYAPHTLIMIDGICSFLAEPFQFSEWGIDAAVTASQKAFGCPPGLCMMTLSERAVHYMQHKRQFPIRAWYANLLNWLPVMRAYQSNKMSYFSTPNTNLIRALNVSCQLLLKEGCDSVVDRTVKFSKAFRMALKAMGLELVAVNENVCASSVTAVKYPKGVDGNKFLKIINTETDVILARGIHPKIRNEYFRIGHMGVSTKIGSNRLLKCVKAIEYGLRKCGYDFPKNVNVVDTFNKTVEDYGLNCVNLTCKL